MQRLRLLCASRAWLARPALAALSLRCSSSRSGTAAALRATGSDRVNQEVADYWQKVLEKSVDKSTAVALLRNIDVHQVLGLPTPAADLDAGGAGSNIDEGEGGAPAAAPAARPGGRPAGFLSRKGRPPLYSYFRSVKKQFPKAVALVRVGEFYEAVGIDAVLLVQHAGLNPMGSGCPPRAGCPRQNLRRTVDDLVSAGLSVVVCEETPEPYSYGSMRTKQKQRFVAAVVTPANPHLLHGLVDEEMDLQFEAAPPLLAVVPQVGGYTVLEVSVDLGTVQVMEGLTEDAVYARLHEGGLAPPLFVHVPDPNSDRRLSEGIPEREWEQRVASLFRAQVGLIERYSEPDYLEGLLARVRCMMNMPANQNFTVIHASSRDRPRPLYFSTALNLGLHKSRGQPCLLDYLLPDNSPLATRRWLRRLLLLPPPPATAVAVHRACGILAGVSSMPVFPMVPAASVVLKLRTREANDTFYREVGKLCSALGELLSQRAQRMPELADSLLEVACKEMGVRLTREQLQAGCRTALAAIHRVVDHDEQLVGGGDFSPWLPGLEHCTEDVRVGLRRLMQANEGPFRGKVRDEVMREECEAVELAGERVERELEAAFLPLLQAHVGAGEPAKARPSVVFDTANNALWIKIPKNSAAFHAAGNLHHPHDRNGKLETSVYASHGLQSALDDYRKACYDAAAAVRAHLRKLAVELQAVQTELVCAATIGVAAAALEAHTRNALLNGWRLPTQGFSAEGPPALPLPGEQPDRFEISDMWPYWLKGTDVSTVHNSVDLEGMALLTGPNMAGKSTILRSVCAVALLGACGLHVPAGAVTVPYFDAFMLRNFSSDSPLEGRSAFAVEMTEMRYVLQDVTPRSLVLVDELGKGTEVRAGASLAGALVEELDEARCRGIFATHLHALLDLELNLSNTEFFMMETKEVPLPAAAAAEPAGAAAGAGPASDTLPGTGQQLEQHAGYTSSNGGNGSSSGTGGSSGAAHAPQQQQQQQQQQLETRRKPTWRMVPGVSTESLALDVARDCRLPAGVIARAAQLYEQLVPMAPLPQQLPEPQPAAAAAAGARAATAAAVAAAASAGGLAGSEDPASSGRGLLPRAAARSARAASRGGGGMSSGGDSSAGSQWRLEQAASVMQLVAREALSGGQQEQQQQQQLQQEGDQEGDAQLAVQYVRRGQAPGPATIGAACVYVLMRPDGFFYAGSTDHLYDRIRAHRQRTGKGGPDMVLAYLSLGHSQDTAALAKAVETRTIRELERRGFPLTSAADGRRRHAVGGGGVPAGGSGNGIGST